MLAIESSIAKYHCLYTQGAVALQTPDVFFLTHPVEAQTSLNRAFLITVQKNIAPSRLFCTMAKGL